MSEGKLVIDAQLDTPGPQAPDPGHAHVISVSRYRVLRVLLGQYTNAFILVAHDRADMSSANFLPGVNKRLELTLKLPAHTSMLKPFPDKDPGFPVYYCVAVQLLDSAEL